MEQTIDQPWFLTKCLDESYGWAPENDWYDTVDPSTGERAILPNCTNEYVPPTCGRDACNYPQGGTAPRLCFQEGQHATCQSGMWACGVRRTDGQSYDIQDSSGFGRICAGPDVRQCPKYGSVRATAVKPMEDAYTNDGKYDFYTYRTNLPGRGVQDYEETNPTTPPQPVLCTYDVSELRKDAAAMTDLVAAAKDWATAVGAVVPSWPAADSATPPVPQNFVESVRPQAVANATAVMKDFCGQLASRNDTGQNLVHLCPTDPATGTTMHDCLVLSTSGTEGDACKSWCKDIDPSACDSIILSGCGNDTPDCKCVNRENDEGYRKIVDLVKSDDAVSTIGQSAKCWYLPCDSASGLGPVVGGTHLVNQDTCRQTCPTSYTFCEQINQINTDGGDAYNIWIKNNISCNGSRDNSGDGQNAPAPSIPAQVGWWSRSKDWVSNHLVAVVLALVGALVLVGLIARLRPAHPKVEK